MMKYNLAFILLCVSLWFFASCNSHDWPYEQPDAGSDVFGEGRIDVRLKSQSQRATTTTITKEEADLFLVTVTKGEEVIGQSVVLGTLSSMSFPAGYGYKVFVENITEADAISLNDGWGARRYSGTSKSFGIQAGQTTSVGVTCTVANAAVSVSIEEGAEGCSVTISDGTRTLTTTTDRIAYFNVDADSASKNVTLTVEKDGVIISENDFTLAPAQIQDVHLRPSEEPAQGSVSVGISYDDTFVVVSEDVVISENLLLSAIYQ